MIRIRVSVYHELVTKEINASNERRNLKLIISWMEIGSIDYSMNSYTMISMSMCRLKRL